MLGTWRGVGTKGAQVKDISTGKVPREPQYGLIKEYG